MGIIETHSLPTLTRSYPRRFTLITRTARARASYLSCVAVYPRDSPSRRVLCRWTRQLHSCLTRGGNRADDVGRGKLGARFAPEFV